MYLIKIKYYLIILVTLLLSFLFIFNNCKSKNIVNNLKLRENEQILFNRSSLNNIKINEKILLLDLTNDLIKLKNKNETTTDILKSGNYIYDKEDLENFTKSIDLFYKSIKSNLEVKFKERSINNDIIFNSNINYKNSDQTIISIEIIEYYTGEYNLIKNELTKFKISVKLFRKDLINNYILLFIKNYKCKPSILFPTEKLRIVEISNLCSSDIIKFFEKSIK